MTDCIFFDGALSSGYGQLKKTDPLYLKWGVRSAHRAVLTDVVGRKLLPKEFACHHCDNRACINPKHLYLGSQATNNRDMFSRNKDIRKNISKGQSAETSKHYGKTPSAETRAKMSARKAGNNYRAGKKSSPETVAKWHETMRLKRESLELSV
jgi:hypothetical protein